MIKNFNHYIRSNYTPFKWGSLIQYFLQGLLVIAPLAVTVYGIYWVISTIDSAIPIFTTKENGKIVVHNYGLGFVVITVAIILIGYLSNYFIRSRLFRLFDSWMEKTPVIKFIYSTVKDFFEAFTGEKRKFTKAVFANVDDTDVWRVGFITQDDMKDWGLKDYVAVYLPMAYSIAGNVYIIPQSKIKPIVDVHSTDAMKFAISGGITDTTEDIKR